MTAVEGMRRTEILDAAAEMFATSGIRASLKDIADACGILPGSLYHHFDSKEAIVVALVRRYQAELERVAEVAVANPESASAAPLTAISEFGTAIAECAVRNRAALLLTIYDPPRGSGPELIELASRTPDAIVAAMDELLRRIAARGLLRDGIDLHVLADRICQSMLHVGIGVYHRSRGAERVPALKCRMLLEGLAPHTPADAVLDRSPARLVADALIAGWPPDDGEIAERTAVILAAARAEFGRRGYEATTIRDVASAAGVNPGAVYRVVESKEQLVSSILSSYLSSITDGWDAVLRAPATPLEKLDALLWLDINILDRFREEHKIQSASLQDAPPASPNLSLSFPAQLGQMRRLLADADHAHEIEMSAPSADMRARGAFSLVFTPEPIIRHLGTLGALQFARDTLLRGALV